MHRHIHIYIYILCSLRHNYRHWCALFVRNHRIYKVSSISYVYELFYTCYCSSLWLHHHSFVYNLFTSILFVLLFHVHADLYAIWCFRAKFYRLLVVSFMGWNSRQVRDAQTFLFSRPRVVLCMLVRRMAWVARTLILSLFFRSRYSSP